MSRARLPVALSITALVISSIALWLAISVRDSSRGRVERAGDDAPTSRTAAASFKRDEDRTARIRELEQQLSNAQQEVPRLSSTDVDRAAASEDPRVAQRAAARKPSWRDGDRPRMSRRFQTWTTATGCPTITKAPDLPQDEIDRINGVLETAFLEYLRLEAEHSEVQKDAEGHMHVTIKPMADVGAQFRTRLVARLAAASGQSRDAALWDELLSARDPYLEFGRFGAGTTTLEIWQTDDEYSYTEWTEALDKMNKTGGSHEHVTELPERCKRYWW